MSGKQIPARDIIIEVETAVADTWAEIDGITSVTPDRAANEVITETVEFSSGGLYSGRPMQRGASLAIEGKLKKDATTGVQDAGQLRVETLAAALVEDGMGRIRFRYPMDTEWTIWDAFFSVGNRGGGGNNDMGGWAATITRDGASTTAAVV